MTQPTTNHNAIDQRTLLAETDLRTIEHHATLDSTNRFAADLLNRSPDLPALVIADEQTAGRGRGGNSWWSPTGALLFSIVAERTESAPELPPYSLAVGLGIRDALQASMPDVELKVKWPNDVFLEGRKVCGVLVEVPHDHRDKLVIGIGINVNNSVMNAPEPLRQTLVSMRDCHGHTFSKTTVLSEVARRVIKEVATIANGQLVSRWREHCWLTGKTISIQRGERINSGDCLGITESGAIVLRTESGDISISSGVVS